MSSVRGSSSYSTYYVPFDHISNPESNPSRLPLLDVSDLSLGKDQQSEDNPSQTEDAPLSFADLVKDNDFLLCQIYKYYKSKGFYPILSSEIILILTIVWISALIIIFFEFFDVFTFKTTPVHFGFPSNPFSISLTLISAMIVLVFVVRLPISIYHTYKIKKLYNTVFKIEDSDLDSILWDTVVVNISNNTTCSPKDPPIDALFVAQRIMRAENYLIALFSKMSRLKTDTVIPNRFLFCGNMLSTFYEHSIRMIISWILHHSSFESCGEIAEKRAEIVRSVRIRLALLFLPALLLSPFIAILSLIYFAFNYGEKLKDNDFSFFTLQQWNRLSLLKFRMYNELDHVFNNRMALSNKEATRLLNQLIPHSLVIWARFITFLCGSIIVIAFASEILFSNIFDTLLYGKPVFWYVTIAGTIAVACRAFLPRENFVPALPQHFERLKKLLMYYPPSWDDIKKPRKADMIVLDIKFFFESQIIAILRDFLSPFFLPFYLIAVFNYKLPGLVKVMSDLSYSFGPNDVMCVYSYFSDDRFKQLNRKLFPEASSQLLRKLDYQKIRYSIMFFSDLHLHSWRDKSPLESASAVDFEVGLDSDWIIQEVSSVLPLRNVTNHLFLFLYSFANKSPPPSNVASISMIARLPL